MRSLKEVSGELVTGCWYSCILDEEFWYFKFSDYDNEGSINITECYSPYSEDSNTLYYSNEFSRLTYDCTIKKIRKIDYSWLMENIVNGKEIL